MAHHDNDPSKSRPQSYPGHDGKVHRVDAPQPDPKIGDRRPSLPPARPQVGNARRRR